MRSLFYIIILPIITGCSYSSSQLDVLDEAQSLMQRDPSAALSKLNGIDVSEFKDSASMARWALLYSEALAVNRLSVPNDTIVNIAIDYYGRHNLTDELKKPRVLKHRFSLQTRLMLSRQLVIFKKKRNFLFIKNGLNENYTLLSGWSL